MGEVRVALRVARPAAGFDDEIVHGGAGINAQITAVRDRDITDAGPPADVRVAAVDGQMLVDHVGAAQGQGGSGVDGDIRGGAAGFQRYLRPRRVVRRRDPGRSTALADGDAAARADDYAGADAARADVEFAAGAHMRRAGGQTFEDGEIAQPVAVAPESRAVEHAVGGVQRAVPNARAGVVRRGVAPGALRDVGLRTAETDRSARLLPPNVAARDIGVVEVAAVAQTEAPSGGRGGVAELRPGVQIGETVAADEVAEDYVVIVEGAARLRDAVQHPVHAGGSVGESAVRESVGGDAVVSAAESTVAEVELAARLDREIGECRVVSRIARPAARFDDEAAHVGALVKAQITSGADRDIPNVGPYAGIHVAARADGKIGVSGVGAAAQGEILGIRLVRVARPLRAGEDVEVAHVGADGDGAASCDVRHFPFLLSALCQRKRVMVNSLENQLFPGPFADGEAATLLRRRLPTDFFTFIM